MSHHIDETAGTGFKFLGGPVDGDNSYETCDYLAVLRKVIVLNGEHFGSAFMSIKWDSNLDSSKFTSTLYLYKRCGEVYWYQGSMKGVKKDV